MSAWWHALGPAGPCAALLLGGVLLVLGAVFRWRWLYPGHPNVRHYSPFFRRVLLFFTGIILMVCAVVFYLYRDHLYWY